MARTSSEASMPSACISTGPCVHAAWPRISRPMNVVESGGSTRAR